MRRGRRKSFRPKDDPSKSASDDDPGNPTVDFKGEKRSNQTHRSTTDPDAMLAKKSKGKEAKLSYAAHVLIENRNGIIVDTELTPAHGSAIDSRTTHHAGYAVSQRKRKLRHCGHEKVDWMFTFAAAAYNLVG